MKNRQEMSENSSNSVELTEVVVKNKVESVDNGTNNICIVEGGIDKDKEKDESKDSCVIDVKCEGEVVKNKEETLDGIGEKVCRICHLNGRDGPVESLDLIQLGCRCKDELGTAHQHCGEAWFKMKGNRCCEICGEPAKNITGVGDCRFMEEWNENSGGDNAGAELRRGYFRGQPVCNFLMACLVIAFVLPWFFHVNMF